MKNIKMKTGIAAPDEPSDNIKTFILVFMAIIWRRVWITTLIYSDHNEIKISKDIILKSLKFNIYSTAGIGNTLKPFIVKALKDGFLMPSDYKQNLYATRAIKLYKPAHDVIKMKNRDEEIKFIKEYALKVLNIENKKVNDLIEENKDTLDTIDKTNIYSNNFTSSFTSSDNNDKNKLENFNSIIETEHQEKCSCKLCGLVNSWDINETLIFSSDPFQNTIMKGLLSALEDSHNLN